MAGAAVFYIGTPSSNPPPGSLPCTKAYQLPGNLTIRRADTQAAKKKKKKDWCTKKIVKDAHEATNVSALSIQEPHGRMVKPGVGFFTINIHNLPYTIPPPTLKKKNETKRRKKKPAKKMTGKKIHREPRSVSMFVCRRQEFWC